MAQQVTVRINHKHARQAIQACTDSAALVLTATGGDRWKTQGAAETVERTFTITFTCPEPGTPS